MKIEFEEKDNIFIDNINKELNNENKLALFIDKKDRNFYLEFTCTDVAKANAFLMYFMINASCKELEEKFGIRLSSLKYSLANTNELKDRLQSIIDEL